MSTNDLLARWSTMSFDDIEDELQSGANLGEAERLLGIDQVAELRAQADLPLAGFGVPEPVVLLPGIMGSLLSSIRGVTSLLWINPAIILKGQSRYLELSADGSSDGSPEIHAVASSVEKIFYVRIGIALRKRYTLLEFPYDWRLHIETNGDLLHQSIERWADGDPDQQFTLVGHSMGGLVSRAYVARHPEAAKRRIKRIIMHGTPHFGAAGALHDITEGNQIISLAGRLNSNNDLQKLLLNMPSAYQLLPAPPDLFPTTRPYPANWDLYDADAWRFPGIRQDYLDDARRFHELLADHDHPVEMIEIAGCHLNTVVDAKRTVGADGKTKLEVVIVGKGPDSGDGTVPLWSATLPGGQMYYVAGAKHRELSATKKVIDATLDILARKTPDLPTELPQAPGGIFGFEAPAEAGPVDADALRQRLEDGTATADDLENLYFFG